MIRYLTTAVLVFALAPSVLFAQTPTLAPMPNLPLTATATPPPPPAPPVATKRFSPGLAVVGGLTTTVGLMFLLSTIEMPDDSDGTTYDLPGSRYCVTNRPSEVKVRNGGCSNGAAALEPEFRPYAIGATAAGVAMMWVGLHKVTVKEKTITIKPVFAYDSASVTGTVSWGGK